MPFQKGTSGNPGGRPKLDCEAVQLSQAASPRMIRRLIEIAEGDDIGPAIRAASIVLDRGCGRAPQGQALGDDQQVIPPADEADLERLAKLTPEERAELRAILERTLKRS